MTIGDLKHKKNGPVAVSSKFGWLLLGPVKSKGGDNSYTVANVVVEGLKKVVNNIQTKMIIN